MAECHMVIYKNHILLSTSSSISLYKSVINTLHNNATNYSDTQHALTPSLVWTHNRRGCFKESLEIGCIFILLFLTWHVFLPIQDLGNMYIIVHLFVINITFRYVWDKNQDIGKNQIICLLVTWACLLISSNSSLTSSTSHVPVRECSYCWNTNCMFYILLCYSWLPSLCDYWTCIYFYLLLCHFCDVTEKPVTHFPQGLSIVRCPLNRRHL